MAGRAPRRSAAPAVEPTDPAAQDPGDAEAAPAAVGDVEAFDLDVEEAAPAASAPAAPAAPPRRVRRFFSPLDGSPVGFMGDTPPAPGEAPRRTRRLGPSRKDMTS